jgi:hypothetical protein
MRLMLTYGQKSQTLLDEGGAIPTGALRLVPDLLVVTEYCDEWVLDAKETYEPILLVPGNHDVKPESAPPLVGQLGQWQEYRQTLTTKARFVAHHLRSLNVLQWPWNGINQVGMYAGTDDTNSPDSEQLNSYVPSLYQPYSPSMYYESIQDELCSYVVSVVLDARTLLQSVLSTLRNGICFATVVVGVLCAALSSPVLFCSVRWEKRRWFLFHGARPPKSTAQVLWTCLLEACSGSSLA